MLVQRKARANGTYGHTHTGRTQTRAQDPDTDGARATEHTQAHVGLEWVSTTPRVQSKDNGSEGRQVPPRSCADFGEGFTPGP